MGDPLHPKRRHRRDDPMTSREAAIQSERASREAVEFAERVMIDGIPRIDEEIWRACERLGFVGSLDAVEHGRKVLEKLSFIVQTGKKRRATTGGMAREWVLHAWGHCVRCRRAGIEKKPGPPGVYAIIVCPTCGVVQYQVVYGQAYIDGSPGEGEFTRAVRIMRAG